MHLRIQSLLTILGFLFASNLAHAQKALNGFSVESSGAIGSSKEALRLADVHAEVRIDGPFADTTLDLAYDNSTSQPLQGLFKILLPPGSLIRDFALKIDGQWKYGSLTEKHKARQTFEEIVRRGNDPAVLSWRDGAEYQVRIFPFPAKGKRWIRVRYWQDLAEAREMFQYRLPLPNKTKLDSFKFKLDLQAPGLQSVKVGEKYAERVYLKSNGKNANEFGAIVDEKSFTIPGDFSVEVQQPKASKSWVGRYQPKGDHAVYAARFFADLPQEKRTLAGETYVFFDTSRSMRGADVDAMKAWYLDFKRRLGQSSRVSVFEFDHSVREVKNAANDFPLRATSFDGGTSFQSVFNFVAEQTKKKSSQAIDVVVITDALPSMETERELVKLDSNTRMFFLPTGTRFSAHWAKAVAERTNAAVLPAIGSADLDQVWQSYSHSPWRLEAVSFDRGSAADIFPEVPAQLDANLSASLSFRWKSKVEPKVLTLQLSNGPKKLTLESSLESAVTSPHVESLWAMQKLFALAPRAEELEKELSAHAERYRLVSPKTSYIVLEFADDYNRFEIARRQDNESGSPLEMEDSAVLGQEEAVAGLGGGRGSTKGIEDRAASAPTATRAAPQEFGTAPPREADLIAQRNRVQQWRSLQQRKWIMPEPTEPVRSNPGNPMSVAAASAHYVKSDWSLRKVQAEYEKLNTESMKDPWFFIEMARAFLRQGNTETALRVLSNLFEISEEDGKAMRALGLLGEFAGQRTWAERGFEIAIELRPEEPQNFRDLAWLNVETGDYARALATLKRLQASRLGMRQAARWDSRFPGLEQLIARETEWIKALAAGTPLSSAPEMYASITWNNDNSDVDFWIEEGACTVSYQRKSCNGQLSNDFTSGYGPEVYQLTKTPKKRPGLYASYFRADPSLSSSALIVKMSVVEMLSSGKPKITSHIFPIFASGGYIGLKP